MLVDSLFAIGISGNNGLGRDSFGAINKIIQYVVEHEGEIDEARGDICRGGARHACCWSR